MRPRWRTAVGAGLAAAVLATVNVPTRSGGAPASPPAVVVPAAVETAAVAPSDRLLAGQRLLAGRQLVSSGGRYRLVMQGDGNLVLYGPVGSLWSSRTFVSGTQLVLQGDGNLVAYAPDGRAVWNSRTPGSGAVRLVVQADGNVVLYRSNGTAVWSTRTPGGAPLCPAVGYGVNWSAPGSGRTVALTFDDGPGASTGAILQILEGAGVPATFFNIGSNAAVRPTTVQTEYRAGFLLGSHTWSHPEMPTLSAAGQAQEMDRATNEQIGLTGSRPCFFRPPYGEYDSTTLGLAQARSMKVYNWSVDTEDWKAKGSGAQYWIDRIIALGTSGGTQTHPVILMHNQPITMPATVAALPTIIAYYRNRGYTFVDLTGRSR
jgi:peptidoglycan/xylan/chitin deacetylase (PgdA/CDA1 family)